VDIMHASSGSRILIDPHTQLLDRIIVYAHRGKIGVQSAPNEGIKPAVRLPMAK
jgi:hypothetical protein